MFGKILLETFLRSMEDSPRDYLKVYRLAMQIPWLLLGFTALTTWNGLL